MATVKLFNLARMTTATTGTGTITLGSAVSGFLTFALAGVSDGDTVTYAIKDGSNSEIGRGVYTASGTTLTRSVLKSTNSNSAISLSGSAEVFITAAAEDLVSKRESLTTSRTYYVRTDGSDSNTGLVNSSGGAFLTIQKAIDTSCALDCGTNTVTIQVGAGTYTAGITLKPFVGSGAMTLTGDTTTPSNVLLSVTGDNCITCNSGAGNWTVQGFKTVTTTSGFHVSVTNPGVSLSLGAWEFGAAATNYSHLFCSAPGSQIQLFANYSVTGGGSNTRHFNASSGGLIAAIASITCTGSSSLTFGIFAIADRMGMIQVSNITFSGFASVTGQRFVVQNVSFMYTGGGGASFFPGNSAGSGTNTGASPYGMYA